MCKRVLIIAFLFNQYQLKGKGLRVLFIKWQTLKSAYNTKNNDGKYVFSPEEYAQQSKDIHFATFAVIACSVTRNFSVDLQFVFYVFASLLLNRKSRCGKISLWEH